MRTGLTARVNALHARGKSRRQAERSHGTMLVKVVRTMSAIHYPTGPVECRRPSIRRKRRDPIMTLDFPNRSRSFDEARHVVRFVGYDGMFEVPFFVEAAALLGSAGGATASEAECLAAFDAARASIHNVARAAYSHGRRTSYTLTPADFR